MTATLERATATVRPTPVRRLPRLPMRARKLVVVLHIVSSVSWLGLSLGNLVLAVTGLTTDSPATQHTAYLALGIVADALLLPISLTAFGTGLVLSLFSQWGLFRHRWIVIKLALTLVAVLLTPFSLLPGVHEMAAVVESTPIDQFVDTGRGGENLLWAACVSTSMYVTCVVLSVFKPSGRRRAR